MAVCCQERLFGRYCCVNRLQTGPVSRDGTSVVCRPNAQPGHAPAVSGRRSGAPGSAPATERSSLGRARRVRDCRAGASRPPSRRWTESGRSREWIEGGPPSITTSTERFPGEPVRVRGRGARGALSSRAAAEVGVCVLCPGSLRIPEIHGVVEECRGPERTETGDSFGEHKWVRRG
jgi:hypothetical protein